MTKLITLKKALGVATLVAAVTVGTMIGIAPANAADRTDSAAPAATGTTGWIRLAHLSPDTKAVDIRVSALAGGSTLYELDDVAYGSVSPYTPMPSGVYTVAMVPAGSSASTKPMISASVQVSSGKTSTVAAYGPNKKIKVKIFTDDLTSPTAGEARIRLIQASTVAKSVNVTTSTGVKIAQKAQQGTATGYAQVTAGPWTLDVTGKKAKGSATVNLAAGSVTTLFVLDTAAGGVTVRPVLDSAAVAATPVGGVQTGGGYLARLNGDVIDEGESAR